MKPIKTALIGTVALFVAVRVAFLLEGKFGFRGGADDSNLTLLTYFFSTLAISVSFVRSLYQAIRVDESYWLVAVLHVFFTIMLVFYFTNVN